MQESLSYPLSEFLTVAGKGAFGVPLKPEWVERYGASHWQVTALYVHFGHMDGSEMDTCQVSKTDTDQQTLKTKQTSGEQIDPRWQKVLHDL